MAATTSLVALASADYTNSCGSGCVDYGGARNPGGIVHAKNSGGSPISSDWDRNWRNQAFRGCVGMDYTNGATFIPYQCDQGYVNICVYASCSGNVAIQLHVYTRNGDRGAHNLAAQGRA